MIGKKEKKKKKRNKHAKEASKKEDFLFFFLFSVQRSHAMFWMITWTFFCFFFFFTCNCVNKCVSLEPSWIHAHLFFFFLKQNFLDIMISTCYKSNHCNTPSCHTTLSTHTLFSLFTGAFYDFAQNKNFKNLENNLIIVTIVIINNKLFYFYTESQRFNSTICIYFFSFILLFVLSKYVTENA